MEFETIITGGTAVLESGACPADIGLADGKIAAVAKPGALPAANARIVDARSLLVLPGGVDAHVHLGIHQNGTPSADDFYTGSCAAAAGGTTTVIDFAQAMGEESVEECVDTRRQEAKNAVVDYAFHFAFTHHYKEQLVQLESARKAGITSFKLFTCYDGLGLDTEAFRQVLAALRPQESVLVHGEHPAYLRPLADGPQTAAWRQAQARPGKAEEEAARMLLSLYREDGPSLCLAHTSTAQATRLFRQARGEGRRVWFETCPHYLQFTVEDLLGVEGELLAMTPPLRSQADREALWPALAGEGIHLSTDHCPFKKGDKERAAAAGRPLNGIGGVGARLSWLYTAAVHGRGMSLEHFVQLTSTRPARLYGLYPRKGVLAAGTDADLVLFDPAARWDAGSVCRFGAEDHSVYSGVSLLGKTTCVFLRGEIIYQNDEIVTNPGYGIYLERSI